RAVEQARALFLRLLELREEVAERLHLFQFENLELGDLRRVLPVMREVVMPLRDPLNRRDATGPEQLQRDEPRRIGLQREMNEVEPLPCFGNEVGPVRDYLRLFGLDFGLWLFRPRFGLRETLFEFANTGEVFVELFAVVAADDLFEPLCLIADGVEHTLAVREPAGLCLHFIGTAIEEEPREHARRPAFGGDGGTAACPRQAEPFARQRQARKPRFAAEVLGRELIERNRVPEAGSPLGMRGCGEEAVV